MEKVYQHLEAWGYPRPAIDWLRSHRFLVIAVMAVLSWVMVAAVLIGLYQVVFPISGVVASAFASLE